MTKKIYELNVKRERVISRVQMNEEINRNTNRISIKKLLLQCIFYDLCFGDKNNQLI